LTGFFGLLLEAVKDVYALRPHRQIEHSETASRFMDPDLSKAGAHSAHRLPIRRLLAALHVLELITGLSARFGRETPQVILAASHPEDRPHAINMRDLR